MKVLKFGGSSVKTADRIEQVMEIITREITDDQLYVVVSALGGVTDLLIDVARLAEKGYETYINKYEEIKERHFSTAQLLLENKGATVEQLTDSHEALLDMLKGIFLVKECSPRTMDYIVSFGERTSAFIIARALDRKGVKSSFLDARTVITTDSNFNAATVDFETTNKNIQAHYAKNEALVHVTTGFIASDAEGHTTTLGRGGSDYTASIFAAALGANVLEIWTDVDGILTCDPRKVKNAFSLKELTYSEAMEMSHFGAKVIYSPTIQPVMRANIPLYIKNTFKPDFVGTLIHDKIDERFRSPIKGISSLKDIALLTLEGNMMQGIPGTAARLFSALGRISVNIILITQASSENSITFAIAEKDAQLAAQTIEEEFQYEISNKYIRPVTVVHDLVIVAAIGERMKSVSGISGNLFQALGRNGINIFAIAQGSSELNISLVIAKENEEKALNIIHEQFFLSPIKTINVFVMGAGLVGGTLLNQIASKRNDLIDELSLAIHVVGIGNSRKMVFDSDGIDLNNWKETLEQSDTPSTVNSFVQKMISLNLPNSVFVDNTASKDVPEQYKEILSANISIVTPNKVAASSTYDQYTELKNIAKSRGVRFLYETNVGAGLPIISTIRALINSGDSVTKIEAVVSGSLSYIFNNYDGTVPFSDVVRKAKEMGYTEPDPREDLEGTDVKRKIIILTREAGIRIEMEDVALTPILTQKSIDAPDIESFFKTLVEANQYYADMVKKAISEGKVLRFVASMENGKATISLQSVGQDSPFYSLSDSDNMVVITSKRYNNNPLVVRGPGAGAAVTAGGVFADIISVGS